VSDLTLSGIDPSFGNATLYTWTAGVERSMGSLTADVNYVGTASEKLPAATSFPTPIPAPVRICSAFLIRQRRECHQVASESRTSSSRRSLDLSRAANFALWNYVAHGGPGIQAELHVEQVDRHCKPGVGGGTGSTGAVASDFSQNPFDYHPEKGPSVLRCHAFSFAQCGPGPASRERSSCLHPMQSQGDLWLGVLSISSISSGSPFTVYSGIQQTGAGSGGVDRPDQIAKPQTLHRARIAKTISVEGREQRVRFLLRFPFTLPEAPVRTRGASARWAVTASAGRLLRLRFAIIKDTPFGTPQERSRGR
jgi:hypothetical protein